MGWAVGHLLVESVPHDGEAEVGPHAGGHDVVSEGCALEVDEAEEWLPVLHPRNQDHVPQGVELGPPVVEHAGQPAVQSLDSGMELHT